MSKRMGARAVVQVTLEIAPADTWGEDCKLDQVHRQGVESALNLLDRVIGKEDMRRYLEGTLDPKSGWTAIGYAERLKQLTHEVARIRVVGKPIIKNVILDPAE